LDRCGIVLCAVCGVRRAVCTGVQCLPHLPDLMVDPFGNYLFQKLVEMCDAAARLNILRTITGASPPVAASVGPPTALEPVPVPSVDGTPSEAPSGVYGVCLGGSCGCAGCSVHRTCSAPFLWAVFARSWCGRSRCPVPSRFLPQRCLLPALPPASLVFGTRSHPLSSADPLLPLSNIQGMAQDPPRRRRHGCPPLDMQQCPQMSGTLRALELVLRPP
jgi:hypothetical protein